MRAENAKIEQQRKLEAQRQRLSNAAQQRRIEEERQRVAAYRNYLAQQQRADAQYRAQLLAQHRRAEYAYQQQYIAQLQQQQRYLRTTPNYYNDPYYYTAPSYSYVRNGYTYRTNSYGASVLQQAVNEGYNQGYRAGIAARQDRWNSGYRDLYAYQDASYGYRGYYVSREDYSYYFRQGFKRGYKDGYNQSYQYGSYSSDDGNYNILGQILEQVLNLRSY